MERLRYLAIKIISEGKKWSVKHECLGNIHGLTFINLPGCRSILEIEANDLRLEKDKNIYFICPYCGLKTYVDLGVIPVSVFNYIKENSYTLRR